jgi:hypothetical protein
MLPSPVAPGQYLINGSPVLLATQFPVNARRDVVASGDWRAAHDGFAPSCHDAADPYSAGVGGGIVAARPQDCCGSSEGRHERLRAAHECFHDALRAMGVSSSAVTHRLLQVAMAGDTGRQTSPRSVAQWLAKPASAKPDRFLCSIARQHSRPNARRLPVARCPPRLPIMSW